MKDTLKRMKTQVPKLEEIFSNDICDKRIYTETNLIIKKKIQLNIEQNFEEGVSPKKIIKISIWKDVKYSWLFSSVTQLCPTLYDPMDCSKPGLPVHHQLLEFTQTHVHWVGDAIQPSHSLSSPSLPAFNLSQHQGLFQWVCSLYQVAKLLEFQLQHQFFQWIFRTDFLKDGLVGSPCSPRDSQEPSPTTVQKHKEFVLYQ